MTIKSSQFMGEAIKQAEIAFKKNEVPIGAVVVKDNQIIASSHNQNITLKDPTAHAEILAIRKAGEILGEKYLENCDLYVSLEPCPMCAGAISLARIRRLYYAASDEKSGGVENGAKVFSQSQCHHKPEIYSGIGALESQKLIKEFFFQKRSKAAK